MARVISRYQLASAMLASRTMAAEAGRAPVSVPLAFVGRTAAGVPLSDPAQTLLRDLTARVEAEAGRLTIDMLDRIDRMVAAEVADAGRGAASVEIVAEPLWTNYVRVLNPPSCTRCAILAGRIYRDNDGFLRHPLCDCVHWPVESWEHAHDLGLVFSAQDAFRKGQIRGLSAADAKAVADGADLAQVVNATSGMQTASIFGRDGIKLTSAGTTTRSEWRQLNPDRPVRLRPESIYDLAKDREDEIRLLKLYGYIRSDAQIAVPTRAPSSSGADHVERAASRVMDAAQRIEPTATRAVVDAAQAAAGQVERLDTRFKDRASVVEKLVRKGTSSPVVAERAAGFKDALRYTVVLGEPGYWPGHARVVQRMADLGYALDEDAGGWASTGYRGLNLVFRDPRGTLFEVQLHTRASLDAAERAHTIYEIQRKLPPGSEDYRRLEAEMERIFEAVPTPPGVPELD